MKILIILNGNTFQLEGVDLAGLREMLPFLRAWLDAQSGADQFRIDSITTRLKKSTDGLTATVQAHHP